MSLIFSILVGLNFVAMLLGLPLSIFLAFQAVGEQNQVLKKSTIKKAWWSFLGPIILMCILLTLWGIMQTVSKVWF